MQFGQEKTTFQNRNMNKNIKHINMCKQRQTEPNQTSSKTEKVDNLDNKDDKKISKPEIHDYFKTTVAACALNKDKSTTQELIQYHEKRIACTSDQNKSEKLNKQVIKKHKNKPLLFQKMLIENEGQGKSMTPVIPNKLERTKVHRVDITTKGDWEDDEVPPSTPNLMREIKHVLDQDMARSVINKPRTEIGQFDLEVEANEIKSEAAEQEHESHKNEDSETLTEDDEATSECD